MKRPRTADALPLTDWGNARRLVALYGQDLRYVYLWGKWLAWDGTRWALDDPGAVMRRAKATADALLVEAAQATHETTKRELTRWALQSQNAARLNAMIDLARSEAGIAVAPQHLDADPWLFNVANGTLDLRTRELGPPQREHLLTRRGPIPYTPGATCPQWETFLAQILPAGELRVFLQCALGYALTGIVRDQVLMILHGRGANGKSTLLNTVCAVLGADYALTTPVQTLMLRQHDAIPNDIARLRGARLVVATESEGQHRLAEARVKTLTSSDPISARFLHGEWFDFTPSHKIFLATNHKPGITGTDHALWRRLRLVPFDVTIPEADQDDKLGARLVEEEAAGILAWLVEGCAAWQNMGLLQPAQVLAATAEYRADMDVLGTFLAEKCDVADLDPPLKARAGELYKAYGEWCKEGGEKPVSNKVFGLALKERGFAHKLDRRGVVYLGLALLPDPQPDPQPDLL